MGSNNVINRIIIDLDFESEEGFKNFTGDLELKKESFYIAVDEAFSTLITNGNIYLEKVEIDLSNETIYSVNDLQQTVKKNLINYLASSVVSVNNVTETSILKTLTYILLKGQLPWWIFDYSALNEFILKTTKLTIQEANKILQVLLKTEQSFYRLKNTLTEESYNQILNLLLSKKQWTKINSSVKKLAENLVLDNSEKQHFNYLLIKEKTKLQPLRKEEENSYYNYLFKLLIPKNSRSSLNPNFEYSLNKLSDREFINLLIDYIKRDDVNLSSIRFAYSYLKIRNSKLLINKLSQRDLIKDERSLLKLYAIAEEDLALLLYKIIAKKTGYQFATLYQLLVAENISLLKTEDFIQFALSFIKVSDTSKTTNNLVTNLLEQLIYNKSPEQILFKLPRGNNKLIDSLEEAILTKITTGYYKKSKISNSDNLILGLLENIKTHLKTIYGAENIAYINSTYEIKNKTPSVIINEALSKFSQLKGIDLTILYHQLQDSLTKTEQNNYFEKLILQHISQNLTIRKQENVSKKLSKADAQLARKNKDLIQMIIDLLNKSTLLTQSLNIDEFSIRDFLNNEKDNGSNPFSIAKLMRQLGLFSENRKKAAYALWNVLNKKPKWSTKDKALLSLLTEEFPLHSYSSSKQQTLISIGKLLVNSKQNNDYLNLINANLPIIGMLNEFEYKALVRKLCSNSAMYVAYKKLLKMLIGMGFLNLCSSLKIELIRLLISDKNIYSTRYITKLLLQFLIQTSPTLKTKLVASTENNYPLVKNLTSNEQVEAIALLISTDEFLKGNNLNTRFDSTFREQLELLKNPDNSIKQQEITEQKKQNWELLWSKILDETIKFSYADKISYRSKFTQLFGKNEEMIALLEKILSSSLTKKEKLTIAASIGKFGNQHTIEDALFERISAFITKKLPKDNSNSAVELLKTDIKKLKALDKLIGETISDEKLSKPEWKDELTKESSSASLISYLIDEFQFLNRLQESNYTSFTTDKISIQLKEVAKSGTEVSIIELLKKLRIGKLSSQKIMTELWQELKSKKTFTKKDKIALKDISASLIELYAPIRNRRKTAKILNELLLVMAKNSEPTATVSTLLKHKEMIPLIDEALFKNLISTLTSINTSSLLTIYDRMVLAILDSGQADLVDLLKYNFLKIAQNYKNSLTAAFLSKELFTALFKSNTQFKEKVEVSIFRKKVSNKSSNLKKDAVLALLFSLSDQEIEKIISKEETIDLLSEDKILSELIHSNELSFDTKEKNTLNSFISKKDYKKAWDYILETQQKLSTTNALAGKELEIKLKELFAKDSASIKALYKLLISKDIDTANFKNLISQVILLKDQQQDELKKLDRAIKSTLTENERIILQKQILKQKNNNQKIGNIIEEVLKEQRNETTNNQWTKLNDRFEYMLNLSNEKENSAKDIIKIDQLLMTSAALIKFIKKNHNKPTSITLFAKITLERKYLKQFETTASEINSDLTKIERTIFNVLTTLAIAKIPTTVFRVFLRVEIIKYLLVSTFDSSEFTYGIIEKLKSMRMVDPYNQKIKGFKGKSKLEKSIISGLSAHYTSDSYQYIDKKIENEFYFDQLYAYILKNNELPFWAKNKNYTLSDAFGYLLLKVKKKQSHYLFNLLNSVSAKKKIAIHFSKAPLDDQLQLLATLESEKNTTPALDIYKAIAKRSAELQISLPLVMDFIIRRDIWKLSSVQYVAEKILETSINNNEDLKEVLKIIFLDKEVFVKDTISSTRKSELIKEAIHYYAVTKTIKKESPINLVDLKNAFKTSPSLLKEMLYVLSNSVKFTENLITLTTKNQLDELIKDYISKGDIGLGILAKSIGKQLKKYSKSSVNATHLLTLFAANLLVQNSFKKTIIIQLFERTQNSPLNWKDIEQEIKTEIAGINKDILSKSEANILSEINLFIDSKNSKNKRNIEWTDTINYFIAYGALPPNQGNQTPEEIYQNLNRLAKSNPLFWKISFHNWSKRKNKLNHLLAIYPEDKQKELLTLIHPKLEKQLAFVLELEKDGELKLKTNKAVKKIEELVPHIMEIWSKTFVSITDVNDILIPILVNYLPLKSIKDNDLIALLKKKETSAIGDKKEVLGAINRLIEENKALKKEKPIDLEKTEISKEGIAITNAGLIMVWPFIATLFSKVGLTEKNKFIDDQSQQRAVLLTQYLTNFSTEFNEGDLILNKLLCGMQISDFVDITIVLSDYEKETATMLLGAVINNWEKLNKTSVNTLQETFLQRNGIIQKHERDAKLLVESKAYDLLLKTIPWNISMIQTTFMKNRLLVEWRY